ncbi:MAG: hypothetical protein PHX82_15910 [Paracoccaceae bacterium]|nr:hypothetical protein [Paracoccaceae bacterium]
MSDMIRCDTASALQDLTAEVMARHCPGIERGHRKRDRVAAGADYAATLHRSVHRLHQDLPAEIAAREADLAALEVEAEEHHASAAKTRRHLAALEAKVALSATEEKRQAAYAARLAKKEEELAALEQALDAMRQGVEAEGRAVVAGQARLRAEASAVFSEKEEVERAGQKAKRAEEAARERVEQAAAREAAALRKEAEFEAGLGVLESVVGEIDAGTMRVGETGKIQLANMASLRPAPKHLLDRIMPPAIRLVRLIDETGKKAAFVEKMMKRVTAWLRRDDLVAEARKEGEELRRDWGME